MTAFLPEGQQGRCPPCVENAGARGAIGEAARAARSAGGAADSTQPQMVCPWKLQSSHFDSSSIFQKVLSHSPVSSFFSLIQSATCIIRRGMSQSLQRDSTVSSSSRGREVLLKRGPQ